MWHWNFLVDCHNHVQHSVSQGQIQAPGPLLTYLVLYVQFLYIAVHLLA